MGYQWVATEAKTGKIITDLPLLASDRVKQTVGRYESIVATLPVNLDVAPADWLRATDEGATHLVLLADNPEDPAHGIPIAGYMIVRRTRSEGDLIQLDLATVEAYLDRRYVGDVTFTATGQASIVESLIDDYVVADGIPLRVQVTTGGVGKVRDRTYEDSSDKTIYSLLQDLAGVIDGPEWYIGWEWQYAPERLTPVLYVGDRIGSSPVAGLTPAVTFDVPGSIRKFTLVEDYGRGRGANDVMAVSSGQGGTRPQSPRQLASTPDRPKFEYRWTPSTSITIVETLVEHAQAALAVMKDGRVSVTLEVDAPTAPLIGVDWFLGDEVSYALGGLDAYGRDTVPSIPGGKTGTARIAGYEIDVDSPTTTVVPILVAMGDEIDG